MSSTLTIWSRDNLEDNTVDIIFGIYASAYFESLDIHKMKGLYAGLSPNFLRYARVQLFVARTDFALACFHMGTHSLCSWGCEQRFLFYTVYLPLYLYTAGKMWTLWYITVSWLVPMCKQDIGMWKVIARTYQGSWSRRGELCYQLHTALLMTQPSFWGYQIFMKNESCIFQPNSNKILKTKKLHTKYIKSVSVIMHMFERLNEGMGYSGYTWTL